MLQSIFHASDVKNNDLEIQVEKEIEGREVLSNHSSSKKLARIYPHSALVVKCVTRCSVNVYNEDDTSGIS